MSEEGNKICLTSVSVVVLIVLVIIIMVLTVVPAILAEAKISSTKSICLQAAASIDAYVSEYYSLPSGTPTDIADTLRGKSPRGIVFYSGYGPPTGPLLDAWRNPIDYDLSVPGKPKIISSGPDGVRGNADDITN